MSDPRALKLEELETEESACSARVTLNGTTPLNNALQHLVWSELQDAVDEVESTIGRGVIFYFGLVGDTMRYGLAVVPWLSHEGDTYTFEAPTIPPYYINENGLHALDPSDWTTWMNNYENNIYLTRVDEPEPLNNADVRRLVIPWELELEVLKNDNDAEIGESTPYLTISGTSIQHTNADGGNAGYRQQLATNMAIIEDDTFVEIVNNDNYPATFTERAANAAGQCPPRHGEYIMPIAA